MSNKKQNSNIIERFVLFVVLLNNYFIPISTARNSVWHFLYWLVSFFAFGMFIVLYDKKIKEKDAEIKYLKEIIKKLKNN